MEEKNFAVVGFPIDHSLSPKLYAAAAAFLSRPLSYKSYPASSIEDIKLLIQDKNISAFSVTSPLKGDVMGLATIVHDDAQCCDGANSLWEDDCGIWAAANTDYRACLRLIPSGIQSLQIFGGGPMARAVMHAAACKGIPHIRICVRQPEKLYTVIDAAHMLWLKNGYSSSCEISDESSSQSDAVVHATSIDSREHIGAAWLGVQASRACSHAVPWLMECVYRKHPTLFERMQPVNVCGRQLLVEQAREQIRLFLGADIPEEILFSALS